MTPRGRFYPGIRKAPRSGRLRFWRRCVRIEHTPRRSARLTAALKAVEPTRTHPSPIRRCRFGTVDMIAHLSATRTRVPKCCVSFSNSPKVRRSGGDAPHPPAHGARTRGVWRPVEHPMAREEAREMVRDGGIERCQPSRCRIDFVGIVVEPGDDERRHLEWHVGSAASVSMVRLTADRSPPAVS